MSTIVENVTCASCGYVCEGITLRIEGGAIAQVDGACELCAKQLLGQSAGSSQPPEIAKAFEILAGSRAPLVYGLAGSTVEAQRAAVALAEALGGTIDLAIPSFHRASLQAMQAVGLSTCTLGEVRQRADVIVFWGTDPTVTHPALLDRFVLPELQFVAGHRFVASVGNLPPKYTVDAFVHVQPSDNLAPLAALRAAVASVESATRASYSDPIGQLAQRLQNAQYSVIFFGREIGGTAEIESLFRLVRELNTRSRCAAIGLGATQCENVLTWQTGYPFAVNFGRGYPWHDPYRYSASSLLERREVDSVVLIGDCGLSYLSPTAQSHLANLPVIHLASPGSVLPFDSKVQIVTARPGVHCGGTVFRMDGVPIKLRPVFESPLPTAEMILTAIQQGVCASCV